MKKKIILGLILMVFSLIMINGCSLSNMETAPKLATPIVTLNEELATWSRIDNVIRYEIDINDEVFLVDASTNTYLLKESESLKVKAIGDEINYISSDWSNTVTYQKEINNPKIGYLIEQEYQNLVNGLTKEHTNWTFTGKVVDMTATSFSTEYNNYCVKMIVDIDGILVGIYNGFVSGTYPTDINGLIVGVEVTITGQISEKYTLTSGPYTTNIEFANPEISWESKTEQDPISKINFLMINDTHGAFLDSSSGYSIGRVDTLEDQLTSVNGDYILIHNGDAFQGSYVSSTLYGLPLIEAFNKMNIDCFVLGNHEFDWGIDKIAAYADGDLTNGEANFPFLGANIYYKGTTTRPDWIDPYTIVEYGDLKVGIIGVIGETQESSILTKYVVDYEFVNPLNLIKEYASTLRLESNCDVVVVATHEYDALLNKQIANLSENSEIDAIFCAHTHQYKNESLSRNDGESIPVVQNTHKNNLAVEVVINLDDNGNYDGFKTVFHKPSQYAISEDIMIIINKYQYLIDESNTSLGNVDNYIDKNTLGLYATDAMLNGDYSKYNFSDIDIAIINTGGVRATIDKGDITRSDVFEVFPFNNKIVLVNMRGQDLKSLCNKNESYLYIMVSDEIGSYSKLNDDTIYQLAVIDYVFEGTYYTEFNKLTKNDYVETDILLREQLIEYLDELY